LTSGADPVGPEPRVGLVGYGAIADAHARAFARAHRRILAVSGPKEHEARAFADRHDIPDSTTSVDEMLRRDDLTAVVVASPSRAHVDQVRTAIRAGKDVLCEIPLALSAADAESVAREAGELGRTIMVCHTLRFSGPVLALRAKIERGEFRARHVVARSLMRRHENVGWTGRPRSWTDDVLWHHGAHVVDTALWLLDAADVEVLGVSGPQWGPSGRPMDVSATLRAPDGGLATVALSYHARVDVSDYVVIGEDETYQIRDGGLFGPDGPEILGPNAATGHDAAIDAQDAEFIAAIREGRIARPSAGDILPAMRALQRLEDAS
jgi:2-hydroxy-4-carboxymuconate semialdehyde hemiacetal dehydrogenase